MTEPRPQYLGDGIHLIPVPLPFQSPPWVNTYAIEAGGGLLLIDCGADWESGREALRRGFKDLGLSESSVHTLVVSHLHPDHVGMAARLVREWGCRFLMHERAAKGVDRYNDTPGFVERTLRVARANGVPGTVLDTVADIERPAYMPLIDKPDITVADRDEIDLGASRKLAVIHTPGHEPAHICLRDTRTGILFSGDHVLPRISPVIMYDEDYDDVLADYLGSLRRLIEMRIGLTYPAHGTIVEQGEERALQILLHHDRRLSDMAELVTADDLTAWEVMLRSFRPNLDPLQARLALMETISHLEHLTLRGRISSTDADGTRLYRRAASR